MTTETMELFIAAIGGAGSGGAAAYYAAKEAMNVMLARLEERLVALRDVVESDHAKLEEISRAVYRQKS
jgi:NADP-dependent 3-hydroxy acid dehydrogenase YdfG